MKKSIIFIILFIVVLFSSLTVTKAGYYYSYWGTIIDSIDPYQHVKTITPPEIDAKIGELTDMYVHNEKIYLLDGKLNKILVLDKDYQLIKQYPQDVNFDHIKMVGPKGIYVTDEIDDSGNVITYIYVADTGNSRILKIRENGLYKEFKTPDELIFQGENAVVYKPEKIVVDDSGKMYVIATGVYEGILELDPDGTFSRFVGTNKVAISLIDRFWMMFMSKEQRNKINLYLPTSFMNFHVDSDGFLYTVSQSSDGTGDDMIKRINTKGIDVLSRTGYFVPKGEVSYTWWESSDVPTGPSLLVDIAANDYGIYSVIDAKRGRIFTYDFDGNLLYIFGGNGKQVGTFNNATSMQYVGDNLLVMDSINNTISIFEPTKFGKLVNEATRLYFEGDYETSTETWEETLKYYSSYYLAYRAIGRTQYINGEYEKAMENFKLAYDKSNYSLAYKEYRNVELKKYFPIIVLLFFSSVGLLLYSSIKENIIQAKETGRNE
ncbi:MAG: Streptogramin lyase [Haloplasmataceae bacterium]|jgi:hypothetical protein|nr:Streptogramin lyase [Haloplasmataceae bacterium]